VHADAPGCSAGGVVCAHTTGTHKGTRKPFFVFDSWCNSMSNPRSLRRPALPTAWRSSSPHTQVGASFRNADVAFASRELTASEPGMFFILDADSVLRKAWTVVTSLVLLYTVFWVRDPRSLGRRTALHC
jgi:hypothetical protein